MTERSNEQMARDLENQAKSITEIVLSQREMREDIAELKQERAVQAVEDKFRDEKLSSIYSLGKVALGAIVTLFIGAIFAALKAGIFNVG
jgi:beta-N-acetylglucosaminidase